MPIFLGQGEALLTGMDLPALGFEVVERWVGKQAIDARPVGVRLVGVRLTSMP